MGSHAQDLEARNLAGVLCRLTLRVIEVGRHGYDGLVDLGVQIRAGILSQLAEHLGRDLLRRELLTLLRANDLQLGARGLHRVGNFLQLLLDLACLANDKALHGVEGVVSVDDALTLGDLTNQQLTALE